MKNLKYFGVQELNATELNTTNGGSSLTVEGDVSITGDASLSICDADVTVGVDADAELSVSA